MVMGRAHIHASPDTPLRPLAARARTRAVAFVLVDALVAAVLLAAALGVIMALTGRAMSAQKQGEELEVAAMLLDEQLNLVLARGPDNYQQRFGLAGQCDPPFQQYGYALTFEGGSGGDAYLLTATVSWRDAGGRDRRESVQTRIAPRRGDEPDPQRRPSEPVQRF